MCVVATVCKLLLCKNKWSCQLFLLRYDLALMGCQILTAALALVRDVASVINGAVVLLMQAPRADVAVTG